ncbi:MAG: nitric oxide synthase oxygenase [Paraglaciecola sp.]|uniref:nitric oxide synthase oxygenase n=1 Tax=Paraglaciecola sp. TaxID=1920173 RepID=UPI0032970575
MFFSSQKTLDPYGYKPLARRLRRLSLGEKRKEARMFLDLFFLENKHYSDHAKQRKLEVDRELVRYGTYTHNYDELSFGAKVAWRNHAKCIGRLYWRSMVVRDCRKVSDPDQIADEVANHMVEAFNGGKIKSVITIFSPVKPRSLPAHINAGQVTRYAGHIQRKGEVIGDRANVEATKQAEAAGWKGTGEMFDTLPLPIITADGRRVFRAIPDEIIKHVPIKHSCFPAFNALKLQWYAVPCITDMILTIGGIDYPCAPFNGFYMGTEIGSRNLADPWRFNMLRKAGESFGISSESSDPLWRDRVLTELNSAVLQSYNAENVTILDHHTASKDFMKFRSDEAANGRFMHADWSWIVPPQASSSTTPFHIEMHDEAAVPNYYHSWVKDGWNMLPFDGDISRSRLGSHIRDGQRWLIRKLRKPGTFRR